jgi:hypothetical protein
MWNMDELNKLGSEAEKLRKKDWELSVKQRPWWPFIPVTHYVIPLRHCEIGVGNQL